MMPSEALTVLSVGKVVSDMMRTMYDLMTRCVGFNSIAKDGACSHSKSTSENNEGEELHCV